jgi:serine-type D-Ala-D-Ala carboxypeptidase
MRLSLFLLFSIFGTALSAQDIFPSPAEKEIDFFNTSVALDERMKQAVNDKIITGAVLCIGHNDEIVFEKAFGKKSPRPGSEPMTIDTIFDMASLSKVIATATSIMILAEQGKLNLDAPLSKVFPSAGKGAHQNITVRQLLTHYSGLTAEVSTVRKKGRRYIALPPKDILSRIYAAHLEAPPGKAFIYSDIGFVLLGKIVEKISGDNLAKFAAAKIFSPLRMNDTQYNPRKDLFGRIASTEEQQNGGYLCGHVQDPMAGKLNGVAGHAGVFSTANDVSRYARAILNGGMLDGKRVLQPETVAMMISQQTPNTPKAKADIRGLGWDIESRYSLFKGMYMPPESFGHTGYTGTSLWIDPASKTFIVLLTNRPHLSDSTDIRGLRTDISNITGSFFHPALMKAKGN